jgi:hypothetical protein
MFINCGAGERYSIEGYSCGEAIFLWDTATILPKGGFNLLGVKFE